MVPEKSMELRALREVAFERGQAEPMKTITIHMPEEVYEDLRSSVASRAPSPNEDLQRSFVRRLVKLIEGGQSEHTFRYRLEHAGLLTD